MQIFHLYRFTTPFTRLRDAQESTRSKIQEDAQKEEDTISEKVHCRFCKKQIAEPTIWVKLPHSRNFSPSCKKCRNEQVGFRLNLSPGSKEKLRYQIIDWMKDNRVLAQKRAEEKAKAEKKTAMETSEKISEGLELYAEEEKNE